MDFSLRKNGFEVDVARTIKEALAQLVAQKYDLLLLDLTLPDGSGFEICKKARQTSNVPIVFLTASDEEVNVVMGLDMGGDEYITKPFNYEKQNLMEILASAADDVILSARLSKSQLK